MEILSINSVNYTNKNDWDYDLPERLEAELRAAKSTRLSCGEVLLPCGLLQNVSRDILTMAETEPCGLRGCILYIHFEDASGSRKLSTVAYDPSTTSTFELYLTLKQSSAGWNNFLPQFLKKIAGGSTVMISPEYKLEKKKLYRSYFD